MLFRRIQPYIVHEEYKHVTVGLNPFCEPEELMVNILIRMFFPTKMAHIIVLTDGVVY